MLLFAKNQQSKTCSLLPEYANRHGLITGATGTGKTISLQVLAERFSAIGVPVFLADIKGDLGGIAAAGVDSEKLQNRLSKIKVQNWLANSFPVCFWDIFAKSGHPIRTTISDMGPLLLSRLLDLNEVQSGVLQLVFKIADDCGQLLLDLKDLRALVQYVGENNQDFSSEYGNIAPATIGAIQRGLVNLESQGGDSFFGEPMFDIADLLQLDPASGRGMINILAADQLIMQPRIYATFLLWLLSELFERLPEVGDLAQPKLVFFFDEAHLLFSEAPKILLEKVEQVVRLIRSKGVGIYFVSQNPLDVPDKILAQLSNRVQHALRAFTPRDLKAVNTAAETLRANPSFSAAEVITELAVGEALVSFLDTEGTPAIVERVFVLPPQSRIGPLTASERQAIIDQSALNGKYDTLIDRYSAYEMIKGINPTANEQVTEYPNSPNSPNSIAEKNTDSSTNKFTKKSEPASINNPTHLEENFNSDENNSEANDEWGNSRGTLTTGTRKQSRIQPLNNDKRQQSFNLPSATNQNNNDENNGVLGKISEIITDGAGGRRESIAQAAAKSMARSVGAQIGAAVVRGVLGSILGGRRR